MKNVRPLFFGLSAVMATLILAPLPVYANHSWSGFHWARTANPFTLKLGDNVSAKWDSYLSTTSSDWSKSDILDINITSGGTTARKCFPTQGRVEVCNNNYGNNGWLDVAEIWVYGDHIYQARV